METALAHVIGDKAEQAYRRGDALEKRRKLMEAWAAYCEPKTHANVVKLQRLKKPRFETGLLCRLKAQGFTGKRPIDKGFLMIVRGRQHRIPHLTEENIHIDSWLPYVLQHSRYKWAICPAPVFGRLPLFRCEGDESPLLRLD
jgi:hypothetical protein